MTRTDRKFLVDGLLFACLGGLIGIGFLMGFVLAEGPAGAGKSKYFLGLHRHQWGRIHFYVSLAFVALLIVHIIMNWSWVRGKVRGLFKRRTAAAYAALALAPVAVLGVLWLVTPKNDPAFEVYGRGAGRMETAAPPGRQAAIRTVPAPDPSAAPQAAAAAPLPATEAVPPAAVHDDDRILLPDGREVLVTGQMSLSIIERETGIPAAAIARKLGLPAGVDGGESLGRLRRRHGFAMTDVRAAVVSLLEESRR